MLTASKKAELPSALLKEMNINANVRFYNAFLLRANGLGNAIFHAPPWMLPKLVKDGHFELAGKLAESMGNASISQKGTALEWSLVFAKEKQSESVGKKSTPPDAIPYVEILDLPETIAVSFQQITRFNELKEYILSALKNLDGYKIKTAWINDEIASRFKN